jgi:multidrug efflux pump subunit AcrA (membrane-fusion protein)
VLAQLESRLKQTNAKYVADSINFSRYGKLIGCNAVSKLEYDYAKLSMEHSKQDWLYTQKLIQETKANLNLNLAKAKSELTAQQLNLAHQTLVSNNAGVVIKVLKSEGDWVRKGETLAEIATGDYIAKLLIAEDDINKLEIGQRVYVELNTHRDHAYEALLTKIYTYFDTKEQSFVAEARFLKPIGSLKSLTQLQANIVIGERKHALVVPAQYIVNDSAVSCKSGVKKVRLGIKAGGWVEILQGLADEDTLILPN